MSSKREYILYLGHYLDEAIAAERGLPGTNPAGSNRMRRLAAALGTCRKRVILVSPGISARLRWGKRLFFPARAHSTGRAPVLFASAIGLPWLGVMLEPLCLLVAAVTVCRRCHARAALVYNYSPALALSSALLKFFCGIPIILDLEDVASPWLQDFLQPRRFRPVHQIVCWLSMLVMLRLCDSVVAPTKRFAKFIPRGKSFRVVSGCVDEACPEEDVKAPAGLVRILYASSLEAEYGFCHLMEAAEILAREYPEEARKMEIEICGTGRDITFKERVAPLPHPLVTFHGFVSSSQYNLILGRAHLCLSLQLPNGRYAGVKTPSKVYEFLARGKAVLATELGDVLDIPSNAVKICAPFTAEQLARQLASAARDPAALWRQGQAAARYSAANLSLLAVGHRLCQAIRPFEPDANRSLAEHA